MKTVQTHPVAWRRLRSATPAPEPRHGHRAAVIGKYIVIFGGGGLSFNGMSDALYACNVSSNSWFVPKTQGTPPRGLAAYGMCHDESSTIYIFGGIYESGRYSNDTYQLDTENWNWRHLLIDPPKSKLIGITPRLGLSLTMASGKTCYLFGGVTNILTNKNESIPTHLNDLYSLDFSNEFLQWMIPETYGAKPSPRESHSSLYFEDKNQIIIYGGMDGQRLGDVWILDLNSMTWFNPDISGMPPEPRSLHTANIIDRRMFIFGGWVPTQSAQNSLGEMWSCTNSLAVLNLDTNTWDRLEIQIDMQDKLNECMQEEPEPRTGHCSVVIDKRIYIWGGRCAHNRDEEDLHGCFGDLYFLETTVPLPPTNITLIKPYYNSLEVSWTAVPIAESYWLQIKKCEPHGQMTHRKQMFLQAMEEQKPRQKHISSMSSQPGQSQAIRFFPMKPTAMSETGHGGQQTTFVGTKVSTTCQTSFSSEANGREDNRVANNEAVHQRFQTSFQSMGPQQNSTYYMSSKIDVDNSLPQNILDEAYNESESYLAEQQKRNVGKFDDEVEKGSIMAESIASTSDVEKPSTSVIQPKYVRESGTESKGTEEESQMMNDDDMFEFLIPKNDEQNAAGSNEHCNMSDNDPLPTFDQPCQSSQKGSNENDRMTSSFEDSYAALQQLADVSDEQLLPQNGQSSSNTEQLSQEEEQQSTSSAQISVTSQLQKTGNDVEVNTQLLIPSEKQSLLSSQSSRTEENMPTNNVTASEKDNHISGSEESAISPQKQEDQTISQEDDDELEWHDVGIVRGTKCNIYHYYVPTDMVDQHGRIVIRKVSLEPNMAYKFRIASMNSCGHGSFSEPLTLQTIQEGTPTAPTSIKIARVPDGAHLSWQPPPTRNITEYTVQLAIRPSSQNQQSVAATFVPVYMGSEPSCLVSHSFLMGAYLDNVKSQAAILFRISAKNSKGYGPATQVRWLQQDRELVFSQFRQHHQPQPAAASRRLLPQRSASSMGQMPQPNTNFRNTPPHRPGPGNYSSVSSTQRYRFASPNPASEEMPYLPSE